MTKLSFPSQKFDTDLAEDTALVMKTKAEKVEGRGGVSATPVGVLEPQRTILGSFALSREKRLLLAFITGIIIARLGDIAHKMSSGVPIVLNLQKVAARMI
ncbi:hypothetical protein [Haladaptatus halobius]|uniref:hypothetical protein n=1 Tax=Haladaptatus halobius TaxID=2884875 RepID=UPI001D0BE2D3|nr:hypothetical protein [Haladaptatus halobius]